MKYRLATCLVLLSLAGCEQWKTSARINPQTVAAYSDPRSKEAIKTSTKGFGTVDCPLTRGLYDTNDGAVNLDCFMFPEDRRPNGDPVYAYDRAAGSPSSRATTSAIMVPVAAPKPASSPRTKQGAAPPAVIDPVAAAAKVARNRLAALLTTHADDVCVVEKGRLLATQTTANFSLSFLSTALATASTIVGGEQAKSILSGFAAVASGTQNNVNATFYQNQLTQAITKAIDQERARIMTQMVEARALDTSAHTVDDMVRQVNSYHQACSFEKGLQLLLDAALDSSGANAALQMQSRLAAANDLKVYISGIDRKLSGTLDQDVRTQLVTERNEAQAKLHGLAMAQSSTTSAGTDAVNAVPPKEGGTSKDDAPPPNDTVPAADR